MSSPGTGEGPARLQGRLFFLTYPKHDGDPNELVAFLKTFPNFKRCIVAREQHADGSNHLHASVELGKRIERRYSFFRFEGAHGDFQTCRSWGACVNYCRKNENLEVVYEGCTAADAISPLPGGGSQSDYFAECEDRPCERDWFGYALRERIPYAYAERIYKLCHGDRPPTIFADPGEGTISDFHLSATQRDPEGFVCVVCGPSGVGKSTWALREAPKPALLVTHKDDLRYFNRNIHASIIFDELRCTGETDENGHNKGRWPLTEQIKLLTSDAPVSIHVRYNVARIPKRTVKIFTCTNSVMFSDDEQTKRRIHQLVNLYVHEDIWIK